MSKKGIKKQINNSRSNQIYNSLIIIGLSMLLNLITFGVFGNAGNAVAKFLIGVFGYVIYPFGICCLIAGFVCLFGKRPNVSWQISTIYIITLLLIVALFHTITTKSYAYLGYDGYIRHCFNTASTVGGVLAGCVLFPIIQKNFFILGVVFLSLIIIGLVSLAVVMQAKSELEFHIFGGSKFKNKKNDGLGVNNLPVDGTQERILYNGTIKGKLLPNNMGKSRNHIKSYQPIDKIDAYSEQIIEEQAYEFLVSPEEVEKEVNKKRQQALDFLYGEDVECDSIKGKEMQVDISSTVNELNINKKNSIISNDVNDVEIGDEEDNSQISKNSKDKNNNIIDPKYKPYLNNYRKAIIGENALKDIVNNQNMQIDMDKNENGDSENNLQDDNFINDIELALNKHLREKNINLNDIFQNGEDKNVGSLDNDEYVYDENLGDNELNCINNEDYQKNQSTDKDSLSNQNFDNNYMQNLGANNCEPKEHFLERLKSINNQNEKNDLKKLFDKQPKNYQTKNLGNNENSYDSFVGQAFGIETDKVKNKKRMPYLPPDIDCLKDYIENANDNTNIDEKVAILQDKMQENGIDIEIANIVKGPRFTRIEFTTNSPIAKISSKANDITMWLAVKSLRLLTPIPGTSYCGVEIPNIKSGTVGLKAVINNPEFNNTKEGALTFALGKDIDGKCYVPNICTFPHGLIAGASGAGKSVCLNSMICSMLYKYSPEELRLILVDPKEVEFSTYTEIPHLLIPKIITDEKATINALKWAVSEMDRRYSLLRDNRVTNIEQYNGEIATANDKLPLILIVIDEVGDIILSSVGKQFENLVKKLAAKARAAGIHLILATQRPTVDVITGTIKANLPTRIAFAVAQFPDSVAILDGSGAEKLLRNGDMLYKDSTQGELSRVQGCFIHTSEVRAIVEQVRARNQCDYDPAIEDSIFKTENQTDEKIEVEVKKSSLPDELCLEVLDLCLNVKAVSISMLQRKLALGFPRAAKIYDWLKENNYVKGEGRSAVFVLNHEQVEDIKKSELED